MKMTEKALNMRGDLGAGANPGHMPWRPRHAQASVANDVKV
jgi:hypothetical protein